MGRGLGWGTHRGSLPTPKTFCDSVIVPSSPHPVEVAPKAALLVRPLSLCFPCCSSGSWTKELGGLLTSAGKAAAVTPAAPSPGYTDGFAAPHRTPKRGISTPQQHGAQPTPRSAFRQPLRGSPPPAPDQGSFMPCFPSKACPAQQTHWFFHPVPVSVHDAAQDGFSSFYVQHHLPPKITGTSLKMTTGAGETGPEAESSKLLLR